MLAPQGLTPLLSKYWLKIAIDVWEHAYYLDYKNVRMDYVKQIWKIINWADVERRFLNATKKEKVWRYFWDLYKLIKYDININKVQNHILNHHIQFLNSEPAYWFINSWLNVYGKIDGAIIQFSWFFSVF